MSYTLYIGGEEMPVTPSRLQLKLKGQNKTITLVNDGEVNFLRLPGLTEVTVPLLLPMLGSGGNPPDYYLSLFESILVSRKPTRMILSRVSPDGRRLFDTNLSVSLEGYDLEEDAGNGFAMGVSLQLKQYKPFGTKTMKLPPEKGSAPPPEKPRESDSAPQGPHTVVKGDCLYNIAANYYGDGAQYKRIYAANRGVMDPRNQAYQMPIYTIYPGQVLTIP